MRPVVIQLIYSGTGLMLFVSIQHKLCECLHFCTWLLCLSVHTHVSWGPGKKVSPAVKAIFGYCKQTSFTVKKADVSDGVLIFWRNIHHFWFIVYHSALLSQCNVLNTEVAKAVVRGPGSMKSPRFGLTVVVVVAILLMIMGQTVIFW